ncbi:MAG: T9SS type A sorting domain-containing protein [Bacteroidota bacterium]
MKKIYTLVTAVVMISAVSYAQQRSVNNASSHKLTNQKLRTNANHTFRATPNAGRTFSGWLNYALQLNDATNGITPNAAAGHFMTIFPDSAIILGQYTNGNTAYPQFIKGGTMLDPKNMPYQGITATDSYSLDSLGIGYAYLRNLSSSVVDTLVINIIKGDDALAYTLTGPPSVSYQDIEYDQPTNSVKSTNILNTYTYLLHESDSTSSASEILIKTIGLTPQTAGSRIGAVVSYKPGYTYSITDSINAKNEFFIYSYQQNGDGTAGAGTDPTYYGTSGTFTSDMNCSYALPTSVRYGTNANGWNGYFIPTWAWTTPYAYEHHIIEFKISNPPAGVAEFENGAKLEQNIPNPFSNNTEIRYQLEKSATVALSVYDVTGKKVLSVNSGEQTTGSHSININSANLSEGVYYYSLTVGTSVTACKKMVVIK